MKSSLNITIERTGTEEENKEAYSKAFQIIISKLSEVVMNEQSNNISESINRGTS